jgi:hypothetical protein
MDNINKWFMRNGLFLNLNKTEIMKLNPNYLNNVPIQIFIRINKYKKKTEFLSLEIDKEMSWKKHIKKYMLWNYMLRSL